MGNRNQRDGQRAQLLLYPLDGHLGEPVERVAGVGLPQFALWLCAVDENGTEVVLPGFGREWFLLDRSHEPQDAELGICPPSIVFRPVGVEADRPDRHLAVRRLTHRECMMSTSA